MAISVISKVDATWSPSQTARPPSLAYLMLQCSSWVQPPLRRSNLWTRCPMVTTTGCD